MRIAKFEGANMREALAKVKRELGDDAVVVSTREIRRGLGGNAVEVSAAIDGDEAGGPRPLGRFPGPGLGEEDLERAIGPLRAELRSLRSLLRASSDGRQAADLRNELQEMRRLLEALGGVAAAPVAQVALAEVARSHRIAAPSQSRVVALVGATGVGKTTTIAKLAARAALVDERAVAIVTLDSYRVGGPEQMAIFADLIGVPLHCVAHPAQLAGCLEDLADRDLILVDTSGRSPRDHVAVDELARGFQEVGELEVHLAVAASTAAAAIDELRVRYRSLEPARLLFTKVDEASGLDELVRAPARLGLPVSWLTTGQAVPEDLEDASSPRLLDLARRGLEPRAISAGSPQRGSSHTVAA